MIFINNYNIKTCLIYITILFFILIYSNFSFADTAALEDGTVLVGKVIKKDRENVVFKNSYGIFKIKKRQLNTLYITKNYEEDINIHKELGKDIDEEAIKKDYLAGIKGEKDDAGWRNGRISVMGTYISTTGRLSNVLPWGYIGLLAFDQGLDFITEGERHFWMPGIRLEGGYLHYKKNPAEVTGLISSAGPVWLLPFFKNTWGKVMLSILPGMAFLKILNESYKERSNTFTLHSILGYEYAISGISIFIQGRHLFVYDKDVNLSGIGGALGMSFSLW